MESAMELTESQNPAQHWIAIVSLAQTCERIWNDSGRNAATHFALKNTDLATLRAALQEGDELVRTKALHLMSFWPSEEVISDLSVALQCDPCPVVRHEAAYFLGITHEPNALTALGNSMLTDGDELVRHEAAEAIGELGIVEGLFWLNKARTDSSALVRKTVQIAETYIQSSGAHSC